MLALCLLRAENATPACGGHPRHAKYEFGLDAQGTLRVADEIHTPDSSRHWRADTYPQRLAVGERPDSFDKHLIREWVAAGCDPYGDDVPEIPRN